MLVRICVGNTIYVAPMDMCVYSRNLKVHLLELNYYIMIHTSLKLLSTGLIGTNLTFYWCFWATTSDKPSYHYDVIKWKHFPRYCSFVRGIHRSTVNSPHKGQGCGALMFSLICAWINGWVNNGEAGDLRHQSARYDTTVMGDTVSWRHISSLNFKVLSASRYLLIKPAKPLSKKVSANKIWYHINRKPDWFWINEYLNWEWAHLLLKLTPFDNYQTWNSRVQSVTLYYIYIYICLLTYIGVMTGEIKWDVMFPATMCLSRELYVVKHLNKGMILDEHTTL